MYYIIIIFNVNVEENYFILSVIISILLSFIILYLFKRVLIEVRIFGFVFIRCIRDLVEMIDSNFESFLLIFGLLLWVFSCF
jgi:hypothetical protein